MPHHIRNGRKIRTSFVYPPIPDRSMDWSAVTDDYEAWPDGEDGWTTTHPMGTGPTEEEAIADLLEATGIGRRRRALRQRPGAGNE